MSFPSVRKAVPAILPLTDQFLYPALTVGLWKENLILKSSTTYYKTS